MTATDVMEIDRRSERTSGLIVVGIDGSDDCLAALRWAARKAAATGGRLRVVHARHSDGLIDAILSADAERANGSRCMLHNEVEAVLKTIDRRPDVEEVSRRGWPGVVLAHESLEADILVLGTHRLTTLRDKVFGTVARQCVKGASCPVVIVDVAGNTVTHHPERALARH